MVTKYGMSEKLGPIAFGGSEEEVFLGKDMATHNRDYSEDTASKIDAEIKDIVMNAYTSAERILKENVEKLHKVAQRLLENEKISGEEFEAIFRE